MNIIDIVKGDDNLGIEFTAQQKVLIENLKHWWRTRCNQIYIYSGRAGTGKTTIVKYFMEEMGLTNDDVVCCALAGKAVTVLTSHGLRAQTIHSLIYYPKLIPCKDENGNDVIGDNGEVKMTWAFVKKEHLDPCIQLIVVDEFSMVNDDLAEDLLSFGIPIIGMGDLNQLPPIFGISSYMIHPDFELTKIMRQSEGDPIIYLSNRILEHKPILTGVYGKTRVLTRIERGVNLINDYDIALCAKNSTRDVFNNGVRRILLNIKGKEPVMGDRMICRQNKWDMCLENMYLTNGTTGRVEMIDEEQSTPAKLVMDFSPDFNPNIAFEGICVDRKYLVSDYLDRKNYGLTTYLKMEYAYMITVHLSQGSQYPRVLFIDEPFGGDRETLCKLRYTAVTRAMTQIDIVLSPTFLNPWFCLD